MYSLPAKGSVKGVYFSLGITPSKDPSLNCAKAICDLLKEAKNSAYIAIYSLTEPSIVQTMIETHKRGVEVAVVCDLTQSQGKTMSKALKQLEEGGITVKVAKKQRACMHNKCAIIDMRIVATGSYNFSKNATKRNDENLVVLEGRDIAEKYYKYVFERVLQKETLVRTS
jgi:phosphatidylserine/phosphatidylglycerophosphate/cardiolipin synthase-like enzyme